jgi:hypothetical protein
VAKFLRRIADACAAPVEDPDEAAVVHEEVLVPEVAVPPCRLEAPKVVVGPNFVPDAGDDVELGRRQHRLERGRGRVLEGFEVRALLRRGDVAQAVERAQKTRDVACELGRAAVGGHRLAGQLAVADRAVRELVARLDSPLRLRYGRDQPTGELR